MVPTLLLFHPGGFTSGDPSFENSAVTYAQSLGFATKNLDYPLCDPVSCFKWALSAATMASRAGPVFAYGDSAGATLAARIAQKRKVRAAACYCPVVRYAKFVRDHPSSSVLDCLRPYPDSTLDLMSPGLHLTEKPILCLAGSTDVVATLEEAKLWRKLDPRVYVLEVSGGHLGGDFGGAPGGAGNPNYDAAMQRGIRWLARLAGIYQPLPASGNQPGGQTPT